MSEYSGNDVLLTDIDSVVELLLNPFFDNFAKTCSEIIIEQNAILHIYDLANENIALPYPKPIREKITFRAAYILETIYFMDRALFSPYEERFWNDFTKATNGSSQRHFGKIMLDLLRYRKPTAGQCEAIAETCLLWATETKARVAVQIWSIEILIKLHKRIDWLQEVLPELLEPYTNNPSPAIISRLKKWRKTIKI